MSDQRKPYIDSIILAVKQNDWLQILLASVAFVSLYLWHMHRTIASPPKEFLKLCQKPWTEEEIQAAYQRVQTSKKDYKAFLFPKQNRRYVVVGGSGLVGGWIVQHLLMRGENPKAIRIFDISEPTREEVAGNKIIYSKVDVSDVHSVSKAFSQPWPKEVSKLPLTVFHTVAILTVASRKADFIGPLRSINFHGTMNVLKVAKENGASCFVSTSSGSIGMKPPSYFPWPWQRWPKNLVQFLPNADRERLDDPLEEFCGCYPWSKAQAEKFVRDSHNAQEDFLTGVIRPCHTIYGYGVKNKSSITFDYLSRGGSPSWIPTIPVNFVNAENVSIGHLAYENAVLKDSTVGGRAYCVTDPNPPVTYGHLYQVMTQLAHPLTPAKFPYVSHLPLLFMAYLIEAYTLFRHRYLNFLPPVTGDLAIVQPGTFELCTLHVLFTDNKAREEIGYRGVVDTLDGFAADLADWNRKWEELSKKKVELGLKQDLKLQNGTDMPKPPVVQ